MKHTPQFLNIVNDARSRVRECTVQDVKNRLDQGERLRLIDVREESEFAAGHLPGAVHISKGVIERDIETKVPDPSTELILYCGGGFRSALSATISKKWAIRIFCRWTVVGEVERSWLSHRVKTFHS